MKPDPLGYVMSVYLGSDGDVTKDLYRQLEEHGPLGVIGVNLFRAQKNSERAKLYRGGGHRGKAYERKQWAMNNLADALIQHGASFTFSWGWGVDPSQPFHNHVLYVDLPTGQVSWHTASRGSGPQYPGAWDGVRNSASQRICRFVADLLQQQSSQPIH